jgi:hypothetical protein
MVPHNGPTAGTCHSGPRVEFFCKGSGRCVEGIVGAFVLSRSVLYLCDGRPQDLSLANLCIFTSIPHVNQNYVSFSYFSIGDIFSIS